MFTMYHATTTSPAAFLNPPRSFLHSPPSRSALSLLHSQSAAAATTTTRAKMSSPSIQAPIALPADPEKPIVLGLGGIAVDFLATVNNFPKPDDKIRSTSLKVQGGGNAGNALTCAARLGLNARLISKVANDTQGRGILEELEADGVDTSFLVVSEEGNSPFTYVIVDKQTKTRTCIHTPGSPPMIPDDLSKSSLLSALDGAGLVYFDVRLHETALVVAHEATRKSIPILIDAERKREGLDDLLNLSDYVVCSAKFPQSDKGLFGSSGIIKRPDFKEANLLYTSNILNCSTWIRTSQDRMFNHFDLLQAWTEASTVPSALVSMLLRLPNVKFVIVTLGEDGCIMLERSVAVEGIQSEEMDVDSVVEELKEKIDNNKSIPTCISSKVMSLQAKGVGVVSGRLFVGTAEKIPPSELVDTTGAGDAFIGAVLYALCTNMLPEKMLPFAAQVAATCCRALGARSGLPNLSNPLLAPF